MTKKVIGLDIGGTKIEGLRLDKNGKIYEKIRIKTNPEKGLKHFQKSLESVVTQLSSEDLKVGIALPGFYYNKSLHSVPNLPYLQGKDVHKLIAKIFPSRTIIIENDANCFAYAEHTLGAAKGAEHSVGVIVGTGLGGGIIINNQIYKGASAGAGEFGRCFVKDEELEYYVCGPGLERAYLEISKEKASAEEIIKSNNKHAKEVKKEFYKQLAKLSGFIMNFLNPQVIVFGGGVSNSLDYKHLKQEAKKYTEPENYKNTKIKKFKVSDSAGAIGAGMLCFKE